MTRNRTNSPHTTARAALSNRRQTIAREDGECLDSVTDEWAAIDAAIQDSEQVVAKIGPNYRDTLLPAGKVIRVHLVRTEEIKHFNRWIGHFVIADEPEMEEFAGLPIIRGWNKPERGKRLSPNHHLQQDYRAVTGLREFVVPKNHGHSAVLGSFLKNVQVEALTTVVGRRMDRTTSAWALTNQDDHYSVIDRILSLTAGQPRVLMKRTPSKRKSKSNS